MSPVVVSSDSEIRAVICEPDEELFRFFFPCRTRCFVVLSVLCLVLSRRGAIIFPVGTSLLFCLWSFGGRGVLFSAGLVWVVVSFPPLEVFCEGRDCVFLCLIGSARLFLNWIVLIFFGRYFSLIVRVNFSFPPGTRVPFFEFSHSPIFLFRPSPPVAPRSVSSAGRVGPTVFPGAIFCGDGAFFDGVPGLGVVTMVTLEGTSLPE